MSHMGQAGSFLENGVLPFFPFVLCLLDFFIVIIMNGHRLCPLKKPSLRQTEKVEKKQTKKIRK